MVAVALRIARSFRESFGGDSLVPHSDGQSTWDGDMSNPLHDAAGNVVGWTAETATDAATQFVPVPGEGCSPGCLVALLASPVVILFCGAGAIACAYDSFVGWITNLRTNNREGLTYEEAQAENKVSEHLLQVWGAVTFAVLVVLVILAVVGVVVYQSRRGKRRP
ncbi:hypothetical protein [Virgisporangium aurantiacum]|uniref:Uncharacterized protein n=1 Tax=Virgisporangium aurantiacum TaxID=175570 RepID=A0A8J3ZLN1_9ACTN|nr:hypothetical protein [Virgisporangium aurantiacum]GIJ63771.1 hypothetical protein Vau01_112870 [Virgisporangium aurantiacum]